MNWDDLRLLLVLERAGGLAAAARTLGVSHTTVSRRLATLQEALGVRLFDRTPEGLRPTRVLADVVRDARRMEMVAHDIERKIAGNDSQLRGTVRLTATESLGSRFLVPLLAAFSAAHPDVAVELISDLRPLSLARQEADLAVRLAAPDESTSVGTRVGTIAYAPYSALSPRPREPPNLIGYSEPLAGAETAWLIRRYPCARFVFRSNSTQALAAAACSGMGLAMLPVFVGDAESSLRRVGDASEVPSSDIWIIGHRDTKRTARVAALRRFLIEVFRRDSAKLDGRAGAADGVTRPRVR